MWQRRAGFVSRNGSSLEDTGRSGRRSRTTNPTEQVRLLDGMVRYRFGDDEELMASWASARNVVGPFRSHDEPDAGGEAPEEIKPAA